MSSVDAGYKHTRKIIEAGDGLSVPGAELKWYHLRREDQEIDTALSKRAREFVHSQAAAGILDYDDEHGFVILHRTGDTYLLLAMTWRNNNELWEALYADTGAGFRLINFSGPRKGTYCVWELAIIGHEQQGWIRYLFSDRDEKAARAYHEDRLVKGEV